MSYTTFNKTANNQLLEPMFFGQSVNIARYDQQKYAIYEKLTEKQLSFFWRPEEIDVSQDRIDYQNLPEHEQHIFISNLKYQILLDSIQGRSPNVALLPIVSLPELENWIVTWSFSECVAEGTEVLTPSGWVDISKVTVNDDVLVYDFDKEATFFEKPKRTTDYDIENRLMVNLVSSNPKQFNQFVTPNHRMPVASRGVKGKQNNKRFVEAGLFDFQAHHLAPVSGNKKDTNKVLSYIERLLIAAQADGSWYPDRYNGERCGTIPVIFSFSKQRKIDRLIMLCEMAKVEIIEHAATQRGGNVKDHRKFKINLPVEALPKGVDIKDLSSWVDLKDVNSDYAEDFLQELSQWDSHIHESKSGDISFTYSSINKNNTDIVQALCAMCGKQGRYTKREDDRKDTFNDVHSVNVVNRMYKDGQSIKKNLVPYTGKVYCIETSTGAFVMRYNGTVSVTGNTIHSRSYTHIIRNIVNDPSIVFDGVIENENIIKRADEVSKYYDDLIDLAQYVHTTRGEWNPSYDVKFTKELKKKLYLCLMSINVLEAIRFYVSFACSFAFAERKLMEGNAKIIKMIARDEALHLTGTQHMINILQSGQDGEEWIKIAQDCKEECIDIFRRAAEQEKEWAAYLFKDGSMLGLNEKILCQYVEYITDQRMQAVGLPVLFGVKSNPLGWMNAWLSSDNVQVAPQETEISSYLVGQIDSDMSGSDLGGFEL